MEISLAEERAYYFVPQLSLEVAQDRIERKKTSLVAGMFGTLISRPNPAEMPMVSVENRLEPFWVVTVATHTVYDRQAAYTIPIKGRGARSDVLGQKLAVVSKAVQPSRSVQWSIAGGASHDPLFRRSLGPKGRSEPLSILCQNRGHRPDEILRPKGRWSCRRRCGRLQSCARCWEKSSSP